MDRARAIRTVAPDGYRCGACGYDLSGLQQSAEGTRCPECGVLCTDDDPDPITNLRPDGTVSPAVPWPDWYSKVAFEGQRCRSCRAHPKKSPARSHAPVCVICGGQLDSPAPFRAVVWDSLKWALWFGSLGGAAAVTVWMCHGWRTPGGQRVSLVGGVTVFLQLVLTAFAIDQFGIRVHGLRLLGQALERSTHRSITNPIRPEFGALFMVWAFANIPLWIVFFVTST